MGYSHELSSFPNAPIDLPEFRDVDDSVKSLVEQIRNYRMSGDYASAALLMRQNEATLRKYNFTAEDVNRIIEDIRNTQLYVQSKKQQLFYTARESDFVGNDQDIWIGPK